MKLNLLYFFITAIALLMLSCDSEPVSTDLPQTDTNLFISGNVVTFPTGTKAMDIYNTTVYLYQDNEWYNVIGEWKRKNTVTDGDGLITQTWETIQFSKISHIKTETKTHYNNSGLVYTNTVRLYNNDSSIKNIEYQWQTFNGNTQKTELKNLAIDGEITFIF